MKRQKLMNGTAYQAETELLTKAMICHNAKRMFAMYYKDLRESQQFFCILIVKSFC